MKKENYKVRLEKFRGLSELQQMAHKKEFMACWDLLLKDIDNLSREEFGKLLSKIVAFPDILYDIIILAKKSS